MKVKTLKRELSLELCKIMGWEKDHWVVHNTALNAARLRQLINTLKQREPKQ